MLYAKQPFFVAILRLILFDFTSVVHHVEGHAALPSDLCDRVRGHTDAAPVCDVPVYLALYGLYWDLEQL